MPLDLSRFGAKRVTKGGIPNNLLVDVRAATKCGTTRFALKAPRENGICYVNFDRPLKEVRNLEKLIGGSDLQEITCTEWSRKAGTQSEAKAIMERVEGACAAAIKQHASTVVVDKATDLNDCVRVGLFDRNEKIMQREYGRLNAWWKNLLQPFKVSDTNLILIHRLGEIYKDDKATGFYKSKGWSDISYECTVSVEMGKDHSKDDLDKFWLFISDCTYDTRVEGEELRGKAISFANLAQLIIPTSEPADWR